MAKKHEQPQNNDDLQDNEVPATPDVPLVTVRKDGETLDVHPSTVAAHRRAGWVEV